MRVGFTGTQRGMTSVQVKALRRVLASLRTAGFPVTELHHGDCVGADAQAHALWTLGAPERPVVIHPPTLALKRAWCRSGRTTVLRPAPYLTRNRAIVDATWLLCACPAQLDGEALSSGTWSTVRYARRIERAVAIVRPDGRVEWERWEGALDIRSLRGAP